MQQAATVGAFNKCGGPDGGTTADQTEKKSGF